VKQVREVRGARAVASLDKPVRRTNGIVDDLVASDEQTTSRQRCELTERALHDAIAGYPSASRGPQTSLRPVRHHRSEVPEIRRIPGITRERVRIEKEALRRLAERREIAAMRAA
jgi:hypothetical protein